MNFVGIDLHKTSVVEADRFVLEQLIAEFHSYIQTVGRGEPTFGGFCPTGPGAGGRSAGDSGHDPLRGPGDDRRSAQRAGRYSSFPVPEEGLRLRRTGSGPAGICRTNSGAGHHQGGFPALALGAGAGRPAVGEQDGSLGTHFRGVGPTTREEEGDCRRRPASAVCDGIDATKRTEVSIGDGMNLPERGRSPVGVFSKKW